MYVSRGIVLYWQPHMTKPKMLYPLVLLFGLSFMAATTTVSLVDVLALLLGAVVVFSITHKRDVSWIYLPCENLFLIGFCLLLLLSALFLPHDELLFGVTTLFLVGFYFLARFLYKNGLRSTLLNAYFWGATAAAALSCTALIFFSRTSIYEFVTQGERLTFLYSDPNVFGAYLIPALLIGLAHLVAHLPTSKPTAAAYAGALVLLFLALVLTASRGAYVQGAVGLLVFLGLEYRMLLAYKKELFVLATVLIVVPVAYFTLTDNPNKISISRLSASDIPRIENVMHVRDLLAERSVQQLLVGSGSGSYERFSPNQFSAHNLYLRLLVENGIVGFTVFLLFIGALLYRFLKHARDVYTHALFAAIVGALVHGMFIDTLHWRHFWLLLGLI